MSLFPPGVLVKGPKFSEEREYGLFSVAPPLTPQDPHWIVGGVNWEDTLCTSLETFLDVCPGAPSGFTKTGQRDMNFCSADPFQVIGSFDCSTGGRNYNSGEAFEIARQRLLQWEEYQVEQAFWTGVAANGVINPSLEAGNDDCNITVINLTPGGGPVNPLDSISLLEGALADAIPNSGVIHAAPELTPYLSYFDLFETNGVARTPLGTRYVIGAGYPGSGPANVAPSAGTTWVFATGPIAVWRSDVYMVPDNLSQAVDRSINDVTVFAERYYAVGFSCAVFAINVSLTCACS